MDAKKAIALAVALTFVALSFSGCLGSNDSGGSNDGGSSDGSAGNTPTPDSTTNQCQRPWPARIDMIQIPDQMIVGETYTFHCQMFVQNYYNCTPSPWWYAVDTPIEWNFTSDGTTVTNESLTNNPYGIASVAFICPAAGNWTVVAHWAGNENYVEADGQANVSANPDYWYGTPSLDGFYETTPVWVSSGSVHSMAVAGISPTSDVQTFYPKDETYYMFTLDASVLVGINQWGAAHGWTEFGDGLWHMGGLGNFTHSDAWMMSVSSANVEIWAGYGGPTHSMEMFQRQPTNGEFMLESIPDFHTMMMSPGISGIAGWVPGALIFHGSGTYTISIWIEDQMNGQEVSPRLTKTVTVGSSPSCAKPWPSTVKIITQPHFITVGQTYTFQARMMVQNFDAQCNPTPWYYATDTPILWIFSSSTGSFTYQSTTDNSGVAAITFTPTQAGLYHVVAQWVGNDGYIASSGSATFDSAQAAQCPHPWPARIDWMSKPSSMLVGQTYAFQCQMYVQNYDSSCNPTPWYYATNTPIAWTFSNGITPPVTYQCTTGSDGTCSVSFLCPAGGTWTVTAQWIGNEGYGASSAIATVLAS